MSLNELGIIGMSEDTLLIDGDIVIYQPCCIFNEDDDASRVQIKKHINNKIDRMMENSGCSQYIMFVTTKDNFRDQLVDNYKANRTDVERPINLVWAKRWSLHALNSFFHKGLEADDLLGIYAKEDTVIWSLDKDLRQIPGRHLDDATGEVITISEEGRLELKQWVTESGNARKKIYFEGTVGLYFQMLIGDSTDNIIGCGKKADVVTKSGPNKGKVVNKRVGIGEMKALNIITTAIMNKGSRTLLEASLDAVIAEYKIVHGTDWKFHLETQANLLFMIREQDGEIIKRWTVDGRNEYFDLEAGKIVTEGVYLADYSNN